jgi:murein DD-endopeptidase MepM/ murein hydrolase activator NlpD
MLGPSATAGPTHGKDVQIAKFGIGRYEDGLLPKPKAGYSEDFGLPMEEAVRVIQRSEKIRVTGRIADAQTWDVIWQHLDAYRRWQYRNFEVPPPPVPPLVFPYPIGGGGYVCQGLHATAGLPGNWAIDFCETPGDPVLCCEGGVVQKLSGHDPADDTWDAMGVFGWSTYIRTDHGYVYFYTHQGRRRAGIMVGQRIRTGEVLGYVGDQHYRPDHSHIGVTSPFGQSDARRRITAVSKAPRIKPVP